MKCKQREYTKRFPAELNNAFFSFSLIEKSAEVTSPTQSFTRDQSVLAYYSIGALLGGEWCRANLTFDHCLKEDYVWVSFIDYGQWTQGNGFKKSYPGLRRIIAP